MLSNFCSLRKSIRMGRSVRQDLCNRNGTVLLVGVALGTERAPAGEACRMRVACNERR